MGYPFLFYTTLNNDLVFCCLSEVCSSPIDIPGIKYGSPVGKISADAKWNWLDVSCPTTKVSDKVS